MATPKIRPFLWFDSQLEEAVNFYTTLFPDSGGADLNPSYGTFRLVGRELMALNGGDYFKFTPGISLSVINLPEEKLRTIAAALAEGGSFLMPVGSYEFASLYCWVQDRFGLSWQLQAGEGKPALAPFYLFTGKRLGQAQAAMDFHLSLFPNTEKVHGEAGSDGYLQLGVARIENLPLKYSDAPGDHQFTFNEAISLFTDCEDQAEVDRLWEKILAAGGQESRCGWIIDAFGITWQIIPRALMRMLADPDRVRADRAHAAMMKMNKIIVADLEAAWIGK